MVTKVKYMRLMRHQSKIYSEENIKKQKNKYQRDMLKNRKLKYSTTPENLNFSAKQKIL